MNRIRFAATVAFAAIALLGIPPAKATTVQKFSLSDLAKKSESIVHARVVDQTSSWDQGHKEIYTYITLNVLDPVKGGPRSDDAKGAKHETTITIRQLGGTVDKLISYVPGMPSFQKGEEVVLFLSKKDSAGYPWVMGLQQGKYTVTTDANGMKYVRNDVDGLRTLAGNGKTSEATVSSQQPLNAFLDGIKTELDLDGKVKINPTVITE